MKCARIQELILTDHMDGELDEKSNREVDTHLTSCAACRQFRASAVEGTSGPLRAVRHEEAPSYIWERVRRDIAEGARKSSGAFRLFGRVLKPAAAFAAAAAIIIAVLIARPMVRTSAADDYLAEQMAFMARLDLSEQNGNGFFDTI